MSNLDVVTLYKFLKLEIILVLPFWNELQKM